MVEAERMALQFVQTGCHLLGGLVGIQAEATIISLEGLVH